MGVEERLERIERLLLLGSKEVLNTSEIALLLGISESQCKRILAYLLNGSRITSLEALRLFGCMRLASRISDLRKSHPEIKFKATRVETTTGKRVAQYYIESIQ